MASFTAELPGMFLHSAGGAFGSFGRISHKWKGIPSGRGGSRYLFWGIWIILTRTHLCWPLSLHGLSALSPWPLAAVAIIKDPWYIPFHDVLLVHLSIAILDKDVVWAYQPGVPLSCFFSLIAIPTMPPRFFHNPKGRVPGSKKVLANIFKRCGTWVCSKPG